MTPRGSARRWRYASGFLFFGTAIVVAGYYVPLRREAGKLRAEGVSLRQDLEQTRLELSRALAQPRLPAPATTPAAAAPAAGSAPPEPSPPTPEATSPVLARIERLEAHVRERFSALVLAQKLSVSSAGDRVSVAIAAPELFGPGKLSVTRSGRALLCELAQSIMAEFQGQLRVTGYYGKPRVAEAALARRYSTPWELSAARAARAVDVLVSDCKAPAERFLVVGYGPRAAGPLGENVAFEFIFAPGD